jgi:PhzF family phenazine biosynthesis protein
MKKRIPIYQIDAFSSKVFSGNPAAVCPLDFWLEDSILQAIAQENNLSETAFFVPEGNNYRIRWFTPLAEVDLCGHATLASAFVIFSHIDTSTKRINFESKSGKLSVAREDEMLSMDFPSQPPRKCNPPQELLAALGENPLEVLGSEDYFVVFSAESDLVSLNPNMEALKKIDRRGVIVTAKGVEVDFVSRYFAPKLGVDEDPVTGSTHCALTPYWAQKLNKRELHAIQTSERSGEIFCKDQGNRVIISGRAVQFMEGSIDLETV